MNIEMEYKMEELLTNILPKIKKTETKNEVTYDFSFLNNSNVDITFGKSVPGSDLFQEALDLFVDEEQVVKKKKKKKKKSKQKT